MTPLLAVAVAYGLMWLVLTWLFPKNTITLITAEGDELGMRFTDEQLKTKAEAIAAYLKANHLGWRNPTTNSALAARFDLPDRGTAGRAGLENSQLLTKLLLIAREAGYPIVADRTGIFYAQYAEEILAGVNHMRACALKYERHALTLELAALGLPNRPTRVAA